jgi:hypothetical protein
MALVPAALLRRAASRGEGANAKVSWLARAPGQAEASLRQPPQVYHQRRPAAFAERTWAAPAGLATRFGTGPG